MELTDKQITFQERVQPWMMECFGPEIAADKSERNHRFFEESTEAVQANGMTRSEAHQLVDYTFDRPVGELHQEIGGVMVTLAALCLASGQNMHTAGETELARIWTKVEAIRAKQAAKPKHSPLPAAPARASGPVAWRELCRRLYVELFHCDQQMRSTRDEDGEPHWTQSTVVRDILAEAKTALDAPQPSLPAKAGKAAHAAGCSDGEDCTTCASLDPALYSTTAADSTAFKPRQYDAFVEARKQVSAEVAKFRAAVLDDERARYEAAYCEGQPIDMGRSVNGRYGNEAQNVGWDIWQKARAASPQSPKGVYFKRSEFRHAKPGGWVTFNIRAEDADDAEKLLSGCARAASPQAPKGDERTTFYRKALYQIAYWVDDGNNSERKIREFALSVLDGDPAPQISATLTTGMDRSAFHDKAWSMWHAKALDSALLPKLSIHTIRTLWDALYDAMPRTAPTAAPTPQQISDYLHSLDAIQREVVERDARAAAPQSGVAQARTTPRMEALFEADAKRLALELECILQDCKDNVVVSRWWDSSLQALDQHQTLLAAVQANPLDLPDWVRNAQPPDSHPTGKAEDAQDAARYRHLRECNSGSLVIVQITGTGDDDQIVLTEEDADAAIDAAMTAAQPESEVDND